MDGARRRKLSRYREDWDWVPPVDPFAKDAGVLRLGAPAELAVQPLVRGLATQDGVALEMGPPAPLAARFEAGLRRGSLARASLDCALLPVPDCVRMPLCRVVPGIGLCSHGMTQTEMLFAKVEPAALSRIAVHPDAGRACDLAQVVLGDVFGATPEFIPAAPDAFDPGAFDGLVAGGDFVWTHANPYPKAFDLGALWHGLTGLPLVRMMWVGRFGAPFPRLRALLSRALQRGLAELDAIAAEAAGNGIIDAAAAASHFSEAVYYTVGGREMDGVAEFVRRAAKYGLCAPDATIELC